MQRKQLVSSPPPTTTPSDAQRGSFPEYAARACQTARRTTPLSEWATTAPTPPPHPPLTGRPPPSPYHWLCSSPLRSQKSGVAGSCGRPCASSDRGMRPDPPVRMQPSICARFDTATGTSPCSVRLLLLHTESCRRGRCTKPPNPNHRQKNLPFLALPCQPSTLHPAILKGDSAQCVIWSHICSLRRILYPALLRMGLGSGS